MKALDFLEGIDLENNPFTFWRLGVNSLENYLFDHEKDPVYGIRTIIGQVPCETPRPFAAAPVKSFDDIPNIGDFIDAVLAFDCENGTRYYAVVLLE